MVATTRWPAQPPPPPPPATPAQPKERVPAWQTYQRRHHHDQQRCGLYGRDAGLPGAVGAGQVDDCSTARWGRGATGAGCRVIITDYWDAQRGGNACSLVRATVQVSSCKARRCHPSNAPRPYATAPRSPTASSMRCRLGGSGWRRHELMRREHRPTLQAREATARGMPGREREGGKQAGTNRHCQAGSEGGHCVSGHFHSMCAHGPRAADHRQQGSSVRSNLGHASLPTACTQCPPAHPTREEQPKVKGVLHRGHLQAQVGKHKHLAHKRAKLGEVAQADLWRGGSGGGGGGGGGAVEGPAAAAAAGREQQQQTRSSGAG